MSDLEYSPLVTIVIPVFNGANFVAEAIDSALAQTYKNIEIIVVNDGSNDNGETERIILSYGDKIRYVYKENGGVSSALNFAISIASGKWISWLSHDDLYFPDKIKKQIDFIRTLLDSNHSIDTDKIVVHTATISIDVNGKIIRKPSYKDVDIDEKIDKLIIENIYNYRLSGCSFLIPTNAFKSLGGFREDIRTVSDVEYWHRLMFNGYHFYCLKNNVLVSNRSHGKQVGKTKVRLFHKELNELYVYIVDNYVSLLSPTVSDIKRIYFGLIKRKIKKAAKYVKSKYLKGKANSFDYYILIPCKSFFWNVRGSLFNIARAIYRKIHVKTK